MNYGLLINSAVGFGIFIVCFFTSFKLFQQKRAFLISATSSSLYWFALGLLYLFVAIRTLSEFFGYTEIDRFFQFAAHAAGGWISPPIVFLFIYFMTEKFRLSFGFGVVMAAIWLIWIIIDITGGVSGPYVDFWASEWVPNSDIARRLAIFGLYTPAVVSAICMNFLLLKVKHPGAKFRIFATSISIVIAISVVILDYLGPVGIIGRPLILLASVIGLMAYSPPSFIKRWFKIQ